MPTSSFAENDPTRTAELHAELMLFLRDRMSLESRRTEDEQIQNPLEALGFLENQFTT